MKKLVPFAFLLFLIQPVFASHLRCGYITAEPIDCIGKKYRITITVFTNTNSTVLFGGDGVLDFGDGETITVPAVSAVPRPDLGASIGLATFSIEHTYTLGSFLISYLEPNRNGGVLNMDNSFQTFFYVETKITLNQAGCAASPTFLTPAILQASAGTEFTYSLGAASDEDNLITYELVTPLRGRNTPVVNYIKPGNLEINYLNGLLTWNTKFNDTPTPGEYNFAVQVNHHVKAGDIYTSVGYMRIDFQVIVQGDVVNPVSLQDNQEHDAYNRFLVPENSEKKIKVFYETAGNSSLEAFSELADLDDVFSFETYDSTHEETDFKVGVLTIKPDVSTIRENPYLITVRAKDGPLGSDINYLIYTEKIPELPVITAIEDDVTEIQVYPNPFKEHINIQVNRAGFSEALIYSIQGILVKATSFESKTGISLSALVPGVYICDLRKNGISVHRIKLVKAE